MSIYKKAVKKKLRFSTNVGSLTVEQLFDLPLADLDALAVSLEEQYKASGGKSFLAKEDKKDADAKLAFDIVLDILETKVAAAEKASKAAETRAHNKKIIELIASKQDEELAGKSVEELEALLQE